jgi:hypothetical protein
MASNAAPLRDAELASYSPEQLVQLLATTHLKADFDAVARVLRARESRAAQAEAQLKATLADALRKVQAQEDLRGRASIAEAEEDSARQLRIAEDEARALIRSAVAKIHEAGEKKQDELSAHLDAVLDKLQALRRRQGEDLYASMAMIIEESEAKLKASFSKIHAPLKHAERDGVASQEMHADTVITVPSQEMHAATEITGPCQEQGEQRVGEMVNDGARAAADGSGGVTLKRKADAVENLGVSPVQISGALEERMVADTLIILPVSASALLPGRSALLPCHRRSPTAQRLARRRMLTRRSPWPPVPSQ